MEASMSTLALRQGKRRLQAGCRGWNPGRSPDTLFALAHGFTIAVVKPEVGENEAFSYPPERVSGWKVEDLEATVRRWLTGLFHLVLLGLLGQVLLLLAAACWEDIAAGTDGPCSRSACTDTQRPEFKLTRAGLQLTLGAGRGFKGLRRYSSHSNAISSWTGPNLEGGSSSFSIGANAFPSLWASDDLASREQSLSQEAMADCKLTVMGMLIAMLQRKQTREPDSPNLESWFCRLQAVIPVKKNSSITTYHLPRRSDQKPDTTSDDIPPFTMSHQCITWMCNAEVPSQTRPTGLNNLAFLQCSRLLWGTPAVQYESHGAGGKASPFSGWTGWVSWAWPGAGTHRLFELPVLLLCWLWLLLLLPRVLQQLLSFFSSCSSLFASSPSSCCLLQLLLQVFCILVLMLFLLLLLPFLLLLLLLLLLFQMLFQLWGWGSQSCSGTPFTGVVCLSPCSKGTSLGSSEGTSWHGTGSGVGCFTCSCWVSAGGGTGLRGSWLRAGGRVTGRVYCCWDILEAASGQPEKQEG
ncbi:hypothetical protein QTO34_011189 [Cnephaeus nilssonii]|uniref:Uncharacterized protein n=1 Tax=Cnephaeus nilssonii TaxID=3371016 RepID=A0AA40HDB9_CNENI|nr:hypothetical protein QTO34_011189 [Eptesicus nilssonii]